MTGGAKGIGRACCLRIDAAGAKVAVNYLSSESAAHEVAEQIEAAGGKTIVSRADVSSPEQVCTMIDQIEEDLGPVDSLVNNAGIFDFLSHDRTSLDVWQRTLGGKRINQHVSA